MAHEITVKLNGNECGFSDGSRVLILIERYAVRLTKCLHTYRYLSISKCLSDVNVRKRY